MNAGRRNKEDSVERAGASMRCACDGAMRFSAEKGRVFPGMERDILIVRDGDDYLLLHGQLRLVTKRSTSNEGRLT
jgi:hypothetical protein